MTGAASLADLRIIDRAEVAERLTYEVAIAAVRTAMIAFSSGETRQLLRSIIPLADGRAFGIMPGAMGEAAAFGAKLVSVYPENFAKGLQSHQGVVLLFDPATGAPACLAHAGEITAIRTAAASAVATDALARANARRLAILGYGEQAHRHALAIGKVRDLDSIVIWGRDPERADRLASALRQDIEADISTAADVPSAVAEADIVCTVTAARTPILEGAWLKPGAHVNVVGSSYAGPSEVDNALVVASRFIADSREGVIAQGSEFLIAKAAGLIGDDHIAGEIGEVLAGKVAGRQSEDQLTVYKSLGHVVQDLAAVQALLEA